MPFLKKIETPFGIIGIWNITETSEELTGRISLEEDEYAEYAMIGHERRKKEFLAVRLLLAELLGKQVQPRYNNDGRPFLKEMTLKISIAHSTDYVVVFISEMNVGIDVEVTHRTIRSIAGKFMSDNELENAAQFPDPELGMIIHWCAKEAVFKCTNHNGIDFRTQIHVSPFTPFDGCEFNAELRIDNTSENFLLQYLKVRDNVLVWCVENKKQLK